MNQQPQQFLLHLPSLQLIDEPCNNTSVGVIVWGVRRLTYLDLLLVERHTASAGFACPAGHVEADETFEDAARREVREATGLVIETPLQLVAEGDRWNTCRRPNGSWHHWKVYEVILNEEQWAAVRWNPDESKQIGWYNFTQARRLATQTEEYLAQKLSEETWQASPGLEVAWYHFLKDLQIFHFSDNWNLYGRTRVR